MEEQYSNQMYDTPKKRPQQFQNVYEDGQNESPSKKQKKEEESYLSNVLGGVRNFLYGQSEDLDEQLNPEVEEPLNPQVEEHLNPEVEEYKNTYEDYGWNDHYKKWWDEQTENQKCATLTHCTMSAASEQCFSTNGEDLLKNVTDSKQVFNVSNLKKIQNNPVSFLGSQRTIEVVQKLYEIRNLCRRAESFEQLQEWTRNMNWNTMPLEPIHKFRKTVDFTNIREDRIANSIYKKYNPDDENHYVSHVIPDGNCGMYSFSQGLIGHVGLVFEIRLIAAKALIEHGAHITKEAYDKNWHGSCSSRDQFSLLEEIEHVTYNRSWSDQAHMVAAARGLGLETYLIYPPENGMTDDANFQQLNGVFPAVKDGFQKRGKLKVSNVKSYSKRCTFLDGKRNFTDREISHG